MGEFVVFMIGAVLSVCIALFIVASRSSEWQRPILVFPVGAFWVGFTLHSNVVATIVLEVVIVALFVVYYLGVFKIAAWGWPGGKKPRYSHKTRVFYVVASSAASCAVIVCVLAFNGSARAHWQEIVFLVLAVVLGSFLSFWALGYTLTMLVSPFIVGSSTEHIHVLTHIDEQNKKHDSRYRLLVFAGDDMSYSVQPKLLRYMAERVDLGFEYTVVRSVTGRFFVREFKRHDLNN